MTFTPRDAPCSPARVCNFRVNVLVNLQDTFVSVRELSSPCCTASASQPASLLLSIAARPSSQSFAYLYKPWGTKTKQDLL